MSAKLESFYKNEIDKYVNIRYERWLDYSRYHCEHAGLAGHEVDLLNETLYRMMTRNPLEKLFKMLEKKKKDGYTELDYFILRAIKMNVISPRSTYRYKQEGMKRHVDDRADYSRIDLIDEPVDEMIILEKARILVDTAKEILTPNEWAMFEHCYLNGGVISEFVKVGFGKAYEIHNTAKKKLNDVAWKKVKNVELV